LGEHLPAGIHVHPFESDDSMVHIVPLDHRDIAVARQIHVVLMLAYEQEARLLNVEHFAPLDQTAEDVRMSKAHYLGAVAGGVVVGALSFEPDDEPGQVLIASLVVHPECQRGGIGRALMVEVLRLGGSAVFAVATAAANVPAIALYRSLGFRTYRFGTIGPDALPLVKLRRACRDPSDEVTSACPQPTGRRS